MTKIPEDIRETATGVYTDFMLHNSDGISIAEMIARAIFAERRRCTEITETAMASARFANERAAAWAEKHNRMVRTCDRVGYADLYLPLRVEAIVDELCKIRSLLAEAGKALEPFAAQAASYDPDEGDGELPVWDFEPKTHELRTARTVATKIEEALKND